MVELGLHNNYIINVFAKKLYNAGKNLKLNTKNINLWITSGSGLTVKAVHKAYPNWTINLIPTGGYNYIKNITKWANSNSNIKVYNTNNYNFSKIKCSYDTVQNYDDIICTFVYNLGKNNDYIWNIATDDII